MPNKPEKIAGNADIDDDEQQSNDGTLGNHVDAEDKASKPEISVDSLRKGVLDILNDREALSKAVKFFNSRRINRLLIETLDKHVNDYYKLVEIDEQLATCYTDFASKVDDEQLEKAKDDLAPSKIEALFEEFGVVKDTAVAKFKEIVKLFPDNKKVNDHLKEYFPAPAEGIPRPASNHSSTKSGKGEAYVTAKIKKIKKTVDDELSSLEKIFAETEDKRTLGLDDIEKGIEKLGQRIGEDSSLETLLRELFEFEESDTSE